MRADGTGARTLTLGGVVDVTGAVPSARNFVLPVLFGVTFFHAKTQRTQSPDCGALEDPALPHGGRHGAVFKLKENAIVSNTKAIGGSEVR